MSAYAAELCAVAERLKTDPAWLANVIYFESRGNPGAVNPRTGATGLIQFMPATAKGLGTSTRALKALSGAGQLVYVERYLTRFRGRLNNQTDVYAAVFYPAAIGKGDGYVFPEKVQKANGGVRTMGDYAAKANAVAKLLAVSTHVAEARTAPTTPAATTTAIGWSAKRLGWGLTAGIVAALVLRKLLSG